MGRKDFTIELDNDKSSYYAGEEVVGKVLLNLNEPTTISRITLTIKGIH